ncbi:MAG: hypothetical protein HDR03_00295 [Lachnospiraceae bacterium]|nr:hypothetical protein [Lachnospiraceae bacterium]
MKKKWKSLSALCLAAVLGLSMPVSTMWAAEENAETADDVQKTDSDFDFKQDSQDETIESQEQILNEEQDAAVIEEQDTEVVENQETPDVVDQDDVQDDSATEDLAIGDSEPVAEQPLDEINIGALPLTEPIYTTSDFGGLPVIALKYQGMNLTQALDVPLEYDIYINNCDQNISISISEGGFASLSYYLDKSGSNESMSEEQLTSLWQGADNLSYQEFKMSEDGKYVLYVKAVADNGQVMCVRTKGLVVDSVRPVITGIQDGGTYPVGTKFGVEDANLAEVRVNEQVVSPSDDGLYQVAANGTSCVIKAKDKADHETTCSITIGGEKPEDPDNPDNSDNPDNPKPGDDITVINNDGTYSLHAGTAYRLGSGSWTLQGDSAVYSGGITFYVNTDGSYNFKKR